VAGQHLVKFVDINIFVEFLFQRYGIAADPDLQFRIQVEFLAGLDGEFRDVAVGDGKVIDLLSGYALNGDQDQALVGKQKRIAKNGKADFNDLAIHQQQAVFGVQLLRFGGGSRAGRRFG